MPSYAEIQKAYTDWLCSLYHKLEVYDKDGFLVYDGPIPTKARMSAFKFLIELNTNGRA